MSSKSGPSRRNTELLSYLHFCVSCTQLHLTNVNNTETNTTCYLQKYVKFPTMNQTVLLIAKVCQTRCVLKSTSIRGLLDVSDGLPPNCIDFWPPDASTLHVLTPGWPQMHYMDRQRRSHKCKPFMAVNHLSTGMVMEQGWMDGWGFTLS